MVLERSRSILNYVETLFATLLSGETGSWSRKKAKIVEIISELCEKIHMEQILKLLAVLLWSLSLQWLLLPNAIIIIVFRSILSIIFIIVHKYKCRYQWKCTSSEYSTSSNRGRWFYWRHDFRDWNFDQKKTPKTMLQKRVNSRQFK